MDGGPKGMSLDNGHCLICKNTNWSPAKPTKPYTAATRWSLLCLRLQSNLWPPIAFKSSRDRAFPVTANPLLSYLAAMALTYVAWKLCLVSQIYGLWGVDRKHANSMTGISITTQRCMKTNESTETHRSTEGRWINERGSTVQRQVLVPPWKLTPIRKRHTSNYSFLHSIPPELPDLKRCRPPYWVAVAEVPTLSDDRLRKARFAELEAE